MFTGIVEELGTVRETSANRLVIAAAIVLAGTRVSDSLAVNGVDLTVVERTDDSFTSDLSAETLAQRAWAPSEPVTRWTSSGR